MEKSLTKLIFIILLILSSTKQKDYSEERKYFHSYELKNFQIYSEDDSTPINFDYVCLKVINFKAFVYYSTLFQFKINTSNSTLKNQLISKLYFDKSDENNFSLEFMARTINDYNIRNGKYLIYLDRNLGENKNLKISFSVEKNEILSDLLNSYIQLLLKIKYGIISGKEYYDLLSY